MLEPGASLAALIPRAVDEVGGPTILATFTVIAALLPMAFVTGLMGPYMSPIPINASMGMVISLAVAFVITPWLALKLTPEHAPAAHAESRLDRWLASTFAHLLTPFVDAKRGGRRRKWLGVGIVVAILASVSLAFVQLVVLKMLPFDNKSEFQVIVDMPAGAPVEATAAALSDLGAHLATVDEVIDYQAYAGTASPINFNGLVRQYELRQMPEQGDLQVNLVRPQASVAQEPRDRGSGATGARSDRREAQREGQGGRGAAGAAGALADRRRDLRTGRGGAARARQGRARGARPRPRASSASTTRSRTTRRARWCASISARRRSPA